MSSNFISVQFFGDWQRKYTYVCNRPNVNKGDFVVVPSPKGNTVVKVMNTDLKAPKFECKKVIKKVRL